MFTRVYCKRRVFCDDPFHSAATKGVMLLANVNHVADGVKQRIFIHHLAGDIDMLVASFPFDKFGERLARCKTRVERVVPLHGRADLVAIDRDEL